MIMELWNLVKRKIVEIQKSLSREGFVAAYRERNNETEARS